MNNKIYTDGSFTEKVKKKVVVYGNCHTAVIRQYLEHCIEFSSEYEIADIEYIQNIKDPIYFTENPVFKICDVFIHQSIQKGNRYGEEYSSENIIKRLKPECRIIAIPNVYQLPVCFFPQYKKGEEFRDKINTVFFRDRIIDELYAKGTSFKEILSVYNNPETFADYDFSGQFDLFIDKVRKREKDWDIKVSDFILENYKDNYLFYDPNHPTNFFMEYVVRELLKLFGITNPSFECFKSSCMDSFEMPLYNSMVKYLFLNLKTKEEVRLTGRKVCRGKMTLEKYVKQYLSMEWQNKNLSCSLRIKSFVRYLLYRMCDFELHILEYAKRKISLINHGGL